MAKKGVILSNNDSRVTFSNTGSLSIDDVTNNVSASYISASSVSISGIGVGTQRILSSSNGSFSVFNNGTVNGGAIAFDGNRWITSSLEPSSYIGTAGGDISGSYDGEVKVINISNVEAGVLPVNYGGTGKSFTPDSKAILKVSSSAGQTPVFSIITGTSGSLLTSVNGILNAKKASYEPQVTFYDIPNTYTWTKPAGHKFARVILQGAGGGGGGGRNAAGSYYGGDGGGSGGFSDYILDISSISLATITVGVGGNGGPIDSTARASSGGSTTFTATFGTYTAGGGGGGKAGGTTGNAGLGGTGATKDGGNGSNHIEGLLAEAVINMPSGGGKGYGANNTIQRPGGTVSDLTGISKNFRYTTDSNGKAIQITNSVGATGASGLTVATKPTYGAGGGGGYSGANGRTIGGQGGDGYALIISW